jgi:hypothetical protein
VRDNIMAGAAYLREMHDRYGTRLCWRPIMGPGRYDDFACRAAVRCRPRRSAYRASAPITGASSAVQAATTATPDPFAWRRSAVRPHR